MATLYITEYENLALDSHGRVIQIVKEPAVANQAVSIGASSTQSSAFNGKTRFVRLATDTACKVLFGSNPTALTGSSSYMAAGQTEVFGVNPGDKVAVIT